MRFKFLEIVFIFIGISIGIILSLQIRANPVSVGSFPLAQMETQKQLLSTFSSEQQDLKIKLSELANKIKEARTVIERRSSKQIVAKLNRLKKLTGFSALDGGGIRITLMDNPTVSRTDFSVINENFVQATDLRDIVNVLFLKDALAIAINGRRIMPMMQIQPVFDSILVGNFQIGPPFVVEAAGNPDALKEAAQVIKRRGVRTSIDYLPFVHIPSAENVRSIKFLSFSSP